MLVALYSAVWGLGQVVTGALSDRWGRKSLIVGGKLIHAAGIAVTAYATTFSGCTVGAVLLGVGRTMVYPTLLAAIGFVARPDWRASAVGI
jgi:MFS family permease